MVRQCFDTAQIYGKQPEQLESMNAMFQLALETYSADDIRQAFLRHIKSSPNMPTPSDIIGFIDKIISERSHKQRNPAPVRAVDRASSGRVPWAFKEYGEIETMGLLPAVRDHVDKLEGDRKREYKLYLQSYCKFPKSFFQDGD